MSITKIFHQTETQLTIFTCKGYQCAEYLISLAQAGFEYEGKYWTQKNFDRKYQALAEV
jgi:hypothetical protein